jgi:hypothetical protein
MNKTIFRGRDGGLSNSRVTAFICIVNGLFMTYLFIVIGYFRPDVDLMKIALAVGVLFGSIAGTSMTFLYFQKRNETKEQQIEKKPCDDVTPAQ